MKKPRHLYAWQLVCQGLANEELVSTLLYSGSDNQATSLTETDIDFLHDFLDKSRTKHCLELLDRTTTGSNLEALATRLRPVNVNERESLKALSDVWVDVEQFVMQTKESDEPEAHELYDLLADPHIREVLVAYDDIANSRYVVEDFDLFPVYTERESGLRNRSSSRSPGSPNSKHSSGRSTRRGSRVEPVEDSLGEVTMISDLRSMTHNSRQNGPIEPVSDSEGASLKQSTPKTSQKPEPSVSDGANVSQLVNRFEREKRHAAATPSSSAGKRSSKHSDTSRERGNSLSRNNKPVKHDDDDDAFSENVTSLTVVPKDNPKMPPLSSPRPRDAELGHGRDSIQPLSPKSRHQPNSRIPVHKGDATSDRAHSHSKLDPPVSVPALSPTKPASSAGLDSSVVTRRDKGRASAGSITYPSTSLPDRSQRHSRPSLATEDERQPMQGTQSLSRRSSHQNSHSKDSRDVKIPHPGEVRVVHLRRDHPGEPIGITIAMRTPSPPAGGVQPAVAKAELENRAPSVLAIQRVMAGSLADRNGSLFPGDILLEFNGRPVNSLDQVHTMIQQTSSSLTCDLKVKAPSTDGVLRPGLRYKHNPSKTKRYIRTFFDYDANRDALMPTGDVGLSFKAGDVLELVDDQDPNWWQVRPLTGSGGRTRLVPSQTLEERRRAFNQEKAQANGTRKSKRKIKQFFRAADSSTLRLRSDIWSYEEVVPWPQSMIPCLLLLGPYGVGRRTLKVLLANQEPDRFAYPISDTTDPSAPSNNFQILSKAQMEEDVRSGAYVEWGKVDGHYYGIRFSAVRKIIASGRTAVLDCQPQSVHLLHQPEFNPCTIFIAAPSFEVAKQMLDDGVRLEQTKNARTDDELRAIIEDSRTLATQYRHLYTHLLVNSNMNESVSKLSRLVSRLEKQPSWIPSGWAYELSVPNVSAHRSNGAVFVPGSSSLSALGIHGLPPFRPSTITRSVLSGISEGSAMSASRLARPPSISSSSGLRDSNRNRPENWKRLYEKRRKPQVDFRPSAPAIPEQDTPSESIESHPINSSRASRQAGHESRHSSKSHHPTESAPTASAASVRSKHEHLDTSSSKRRQPHSPKPDSSMDSGARTPQIGNSSHRERSIDESERKTEIHVVSAPTGDNEGDISSTSSEDDTQEGDSNLLV